VIILIRLFIVEAVRNLMEEYGIMEMCGLWTGNRICGLVPPAGYMQ